MSRHYTKEISLNSSRQLNLNEIYFQILFSIEKNMFDSAIALINKHNIDDLSIFKSQKNFNEFIKYKKMSK